jgi:hypothetical protein
MASVSTRPGDFTPRAARTSDATDRAAFYERWLKVWVALIAIVVVVVVVFLIFISNALAGIDSNLGVTTSAVKSVGGNAKTLPGQIANINGSLDAINTDLSPIDGEARTIVSNLNTIETNLSTTSGSLVSTASLLTGTAGTLTTVSGSLGNTEGVLTAVAGLAGQINTSLNNTWEPNGACSVPVTNGVYTPPAGSTTASVGSCGASQLGVSNIFQRLEIANGGLNAIHTQLTSTSNGLVSVDGHLTSI